MEPFSYAVYNTYVSDEVCWNLNFLIEPIFKDRSINKNKFQFFKMVKLWKRFYVAVTMLGKKSEDSSMTIYNLYN